MDTTVTKLSLNVEVSNEIHKLYNLMEDSIFVKAFCENPQTAINEAGLNLDISTLTSTFTDNQNLYDSFIEKLAGKIDTTVFNSHVSSCCS